MFAAALMGNAHETIAKVHRSFALFFFLTV
jgi:hypothetical protein